MTLRDPHHQRHAVRAGNATERVGERPGHDLRVLHVGAVVAPAIGPRRLTLLGVRKRIADLSRIPRHEQLREDDDLGAPAGRLGRELLDPRQPRRGVHVRGLYLDHRDAGHSSSFIRFDTWSAPRPYPSTSGIESRVYVRSAGGW